MSGDSAWTHGSLDVEFEGDALADGCGEFGVELLAADEETEVGFVAVEGLKEEVVVDLGFGEDVEPVALGGDQVFDDGQADFGGDAEEAGIWIRGCGRHSGGGCC